MSLMKCFNADNLDKYKRSYLIKCAADHGCYVCIKHDQTFACLQTRIAFQSQFFYLNRLSVQISIGLVHAIDVELDKSRHGDYRL